MADDLTSSRLVAATSHHAPIFIFTIKITTGVGWDAQWSTGLGRLAGGLRLERLAGGAMGSKVRLGQGLGRDLGVRGCGVGRSQRFVL